MAILKHIDFEVPGFGEFAEPPSTPAITQALGVTPTELPGQTALRIDTAGDSGRLEHELAQPADVLHVRLLFNASQVTGGLIIFALGFDDAGVPAWLLSYNALTRTIRLSVGASQLSVTPPVTPAWHALEFTLDSVNGAIALRLNGVERGSDSAAVSPTRNVWIGIVSTSGSIAGPIDLDHIVLADAPIGLPVARAQADHAGDPRRWLVVYNRADADSAAWADAYRARRGVPYANLCGLALPAGETITPSAYQAMRQQIADYLADNAMTGQIVGLLLGFGVPGYADLAGLAAPTPIANYLHTDNTHGDSVVNPLHQDPLTQRPTASAMAGVRLTGRIDAPDLAGALALLDRADAVMAQTLAHDQGADVVIDPTPGAPDIGPAYAQQVADWVEGDAFARLRLPAVVHDAAPPESAAGAAVVWGWRDAAPSPTFFQSPAGRRVVCQQFATDALPATTLRSASATDWLCAALQAGFAAAAAPCRPYSLGTLPLPHLFFEALRRGWTLAEAWLLAKPFLRDGLQLVGDPLMTVGFPNAGFDVFGPIDRLEQIDLDQPAAILHAGQRELQLGPTDAPSADGSRYLVRRYDSQGRPDAASAAIHTARQQGTRVTPANPAWPRSANWRVRQTNGRVTLVAVWPATLKTLGVDRVELDAQTGEDPPALIDQQSPKQGQRRAIFTIDRPAQPTRYRFRTVQGPAGFVTPWSAWVAPAPGTHASLTLLETSA
jgi:uncharacterized protein (TIGR03790 family)